MSGILNTTVDVIRGAADGNMLKNLDPNVNIIGAYAEARAEKTADFLAAVIKKEIDVSNLPVNSADIAEREPAMIATAIYAQSNGIPLQNLSANNTKEMADSYAWAAQVTHAINSNDFGLFGKFDIATPLMAESLNKELEKRGVSINDIAPSHSQQEPSNNWQNFVTSQRQNGASQERGV